jgi:hypothetical protein
MSELSVSSPIEGLALKFACTQSVSKGVKGQLIKSRTTEKPSKAEEHELNILTFHRKLGECATDVLSEFNNFNNSKDQALADMVMRNAINKFQITKRVAFSVFGIGSPRWKRVMSNNLVIKKEDRGYFNPSSIVENDLCAFKSFVESLPTEPGYPCNHRRQKL